MSSSSNNNSSINDDDVGDIRRIARRLMDCIYDRALAQARQLIKNLTREERTAVTRQIVYYYDDGDDVDECDTLMFTAVNMGRPKFVRFLLEECYAEVNEGWGNVTPLHLAANALYQQKEVVSLLVDHGANVNATGYGVCTHVLIASGRSDLEVVRYLVEKGADIHTPNGDGQACLMRSIYRQQASIKMSQYLLDQGSSVNAVDNLGDPALHYALRSGRYGPLITDMKCLVNLLLHQGADTSIRNQSGDDALQTAALHSSPEIIDYLIDKLKPTPGRCADLYSLIASRFVDECANFTGAMDLWKESVSIRLDTPEDEPMAGPNHAVYNGTVEARDVESLEAIVGDRDALYMQTLICRERILGSSHYETTHWLSMRTWRYAYSNAFQRGIDLYKYASASCGPASIHPFRGLGPHALFVRVLLDKHEQNGSVRFSDVAAALRMMVGMSKCELNSYCDMASIKYDILLTSIDVLDLLCRLKSSEMEARSLRELVSALVQSGCKTDDDGSLLHVAVHFCKYDDPSNAILVELLEAGADVNEVDSSGNTPLHLAVK